MADILVSGSSSAGRRYLPAGGSDGQYIKNVGGTPVWVAETPGGTVTEAGANVANAIGAQAGTTVMLKVMQQLGWTQYGGAVSTDLNTISVSGHYTALGTATGVPSTSYSWFVHHVNSNVTAEPAYQTAVAFTSTDYLLYERRKIGGVWESWQNKSPVTRVNMPDGATAVYASNFATTDGWGGDSASVLNNTLIITSAGSTILQSKSVAGAAGKTYLVKVKVSKPGAVVNIRYYTGSSGVTIASQVMANANQPAVVSGIIGVDYAGIIYIQVTGISSGDTITVYNVWVGDYSYLTGSLSEEGIRILDQLGDTAGVGSAAYAILNSTGVLPTAGKKFTVNGKVYTFTSGTPSVEGDVYVGATAAEGLDNAALAVNGDAATKGTKHFCAANHPNVKATTNTDTTQKLEAWDWTNGVPLAANRGNQLTITTDEPTYTISNSLLTTGATVFSGGMGDVGKKIITQIENNIAASGTRPAAAMITITDPTKVGYEVNVHVAAGAYYTFPPNGTFLYFSDTYGATYGGNINGSCAGGTAGTLTASANMVLRVRRTIA